MKKFSVGDKVSFINEPRSGTVTGFGRKDTVIVEVEGFEIPVHASELLLIEKAPVPELPSVISAQNDIQQENKFSWLKNDALHLVAAPSEELQVFTGPVSYWLVNRTSLHVLFSVSFLKEVGYITTAKGVLAPGHDIRLFKKTREELSEWKKLNIQLIFCSENFFSLYQPQSHDIAVMLPDLKSEVTGAGGLFDFARVKLLADFSEPEVELETLQKHFKEGGAAVKKTPVKTAILKNEDIIDLHIEKITDDYQNLDAAAMMRMQLEVFRRELDVAIRNHYHRIIFIHGVGAGVLRQALLDELKFYPGISARPASFEQFGNGALEITLR